MIRVAEVRLGLAARRSTEIDRDMVKLPQLGPRSQHEDDTEVKMHHHLVL